VLEMSLDIGENLDACYKMLNGLFNKHYREELLNIDGVKRGKFILEHDPETGDPEINFIWWNNFGLEEPDEMTEEFEEEFDQVYHNKLRPKEKEVHQAIRNIKEQFVDEFYPDISAFHEINEGNFEIAMERDKTTNQDRS